MAFKDPREPFTRISVQEAKEKIDAGDVQVIDTVSPTTIDTLRRAPGIGLLQTGSLGYQGITFNVGNADGVGETPGKVDSPAAKDPRVRQAFELSLDREALVNSVFSNWFEPACSPISPDTVFATEASNACPPFDPKKAKALLREYGVPVPRGEVAETPAQARAVAERLGGRVVVKAQVHAGGRGKAGGVKLADDPAAAEAAARQILGMMLKTPQTPPEGIKVLRVLVEEASPIAAELYCSITLDRARSAHVVMASAGRDSRRRLGNRSASRSGSR